MRVTTSFNDNWTFEKEGNKTQVALPHTWNAIDGQTGPAMYYRGVCSYEKNLKRQSYRQDSSAIWSLGA